MVELPAADLPRGNPEVKIFARAGPQCNTWRRAKFRRKSVSALPLGGAQCYFAFWACHVPPAVISVGRPCAGTGAALQLAVGARHLLAGGEAGGNIAIVFEIAPNLDVLHTGGDDAAAFDVNRARNIRRAFADGGARLDLPVAVELPGKGGGRARRAPASGRR